MDWIVGQVYGVPRWAVIGGALFVLLLARKVIAARSSSSPPDGGMPVMTHTAGRHRDYRTVRRAA